MIVGLRPGQARGLGATGLTSPQCWWAPRWRVAASLVVATTLSVKFPWSLSGMVICKPVSRGRVRVQVLPRRALP